MKKYNVTVNGTAYEITLEVVDAADVKAAPAPAPKAAFDFDSDAVANEISQSLEALVGTTEDSAPVAPPQHPASETTTSKFDNLQFGRNYPQGDKQ